MNDQAATNTVRDAYSLLAAVDHLAADNIRMRNALERMLVRATLPPEFRQIVRDALGDFGE